MKKETVGRLHAQFEGIVRVIVGTGMEAWVGRDLQKVLGYVDWRNFEDVIEKAKMACKNSGHNPTDHFVDVNKMVPVGSDAKREVKDVVLTRYACYLIAQNGDPSKEQIAFAQTYFAVQTRKQEIIEKRIGDAERINARRKLAESEKELSVVIDERVSDPIGFARIRSRGDKALFGGYTTKAMKQRLGVPTKRPLADFLPTITVKAKDFANEITTHNVKKQDIGTEGEITLEHVKNNDGVRKLLLDRNIVPESLPPSEDVKKVERRLESEKKLIMPK